MVPNDATVRYMDSVTLTCVGMGLPEVSYQWLREVGGGVYTPVTLDNRVSADEGNLTIATVMREDAGTYLCNVSNELGSIGAPATVTVIGRWVWYAGGCGIQVGIGKYFSPAIGDVTVYPCVP